MVYPFFRIVLFFLHCLVVRSVKGQKNIPKKTPFIIVSNHNHLVDPLLIIYLIVKKLDRKVHFLATPSWDFLGKNICIDWMGCIMLYDSKRSYDEMKAHLKMGNIVGIFPEGHLRLRKVKRKTPRTGAVRLSMETKTPILPIAIRHKGGIFKYRIRIGELIYIEKNKTSIESKSNRIMKEIYRLREIL